MLKYKIQTRVIKGQFIPVKKNSSLIETNILKILEYGINTNKNKAFTFKALKDLKKIQMLEIKKQLNLLKAKKINFLRLKYKALNKNIFELNLDFSTQQKKSKKDILNFINKYKLNKGLSNNPPYIYTLNFYNIYLSHFSALNSLEFQILNLEKNIKNFESFYNDFKQDLKITEYDLRKAQKGILTNKASAFLFFYFNTLKKSKNHKIKGLHDKQRVDLLDFKKDLKVINSSHMVELIKINKEIGFKNYQENNFISIDRKTKKTILTNL